MTFRNALSVSQKGVKNKKYLKKWAICFAFRFFCLPLHPQLSANTLGCSPAATRADCKSAVIRLRRFESYHPNSIICNHGAVTFLCGRIFIWSFFLIVFFDRFFCSFFRVDFEPLARLCVKLCKKQRLKVCRLVFIVLLLHKISGTSAKIAIKLASLPSVCIIFS